MPKVTIGNPKEGLDKEGLDMVEPNDRQKLLNFWASGLLNGITPSEFWNKHAWTHKYKFSVFQNMWANTKHNTGRAVAVNTKSVAGGEMVCDIGVRILFCIFSETMTS